MASWTSARPTHGRISSGGTTFPMQIGLWLTRMRRVQHWCQEPAATEAGRRASSVRPAISFAPPSGARAVVEVEAGEVVRAAASSELIVGTAVTMAPAGAISLPQIVRSALVPLTQAHQAQGAGDPIELCVSFLDCSGWSQEFPRGSEGV